MTAPKLYYAPDHPDGMVIEDTSGSMFRVPEMAPFTGDLQTLVPIRSDGAPDFPGEMMMALVGVAEIAERAGVQPSTVHAWRTRHDDFPDPIASLKAGPVWRWASIERWLRVRPPMGRPVRHSTMSVRVPVPTRPVLRHLRGDGVTKTYRLRDRFEPGSVQIEVNGVPSQVVEDPDGRRFTITPAPPGAADITLEYRSILG